MKKKLFATAAAAALVSVFAFGASAQDASADQARDGKKWEKRGQDKGFGGKRKGGRGMMGGRFMRGVELTDAQKAQIKAIHEANRPDPTVREEMRGLMKAKFDGTITAEQTARLDAIRKMRLDNMVSVRNQIDSILTAEQKAKIEANKVEMKAKMAERKQMREARKAQKPTDN